MLFELLVIDMQNDFIASAGLVGRSGCDVSAAQKLAEYLPDFIDPAATPVIFVLMCWRTTLSITLISTPSFAPMRFAPLF
jgi:nicotinamidase-related amidase